jgi:hypothetical protein
MSRVDPRLIANMIDADDPNVVREALRVPTQSHQGQYQADEVPLIPGLQPNDPRQIYGSVIYNYEMSLDGGFEKATMDTPASSPNVQITAVQSQITDAYDSNGQAIPASPQYVKAAEEYFWRNLLDRVEEMEYEKMGSGKYGPHDPGEDLY